MGALLVAAHRDSQKCYLFSDNLSENNEATIKQTWKRALLSLPIITG